MPGRPNHFEIADRRRNPLPTLQYNIRLQLVKALADFARRHADLGNNLLRHASRSEYVGRPDLVLVVRREFVEILQILAVKSQARSGQPQEFRRQSDVIGMHVCQQNLADIFPRDADALDGALERSEARLRIHAAVDQQAAIGETDEVDVNQSDRKGKRQFDEVNARQYLAIIAADFEVWSQAS